MLIGPGTPGDFGDFGKVLFGEVGDILQFLEGIDATKA